MADLQAIVERLAQRLGPLAGVPVALDGGITNRNFRVRLGAQDYVLRLPGKDTGLLGINRDAERIANQAAARLGIAPAVAAAGREFLLTEFLVCAPVDPDGLRADPAPAARALRAFHRSGTALPTRFWVPALLDQYVEIVRGRGRTLPEAYEPTRALAHRIAAALPLEDPVPCHNDLLPANLLRAGERLMLVDWEYAGLGHGLFDLGNLSVNNEFDEGADERLLAAYYDGPPNDGRRAALKLMRIMSDAREAAWGVVQGAISELEFDFFAYAARHFDRLQQAATGPQLGDWLHAAAA